MVVTIMSGKGGTGKTTFSVFLAKELAERKCHVVLSDLDVEEPNIGLFFKDKIETIRQEALVYKPEWDKEKCSFCGKCQSLCRFSAIARLPGKILVFEELCHSCFACSELCLLGALSMKKRRIGEIISYSVNDRLKFIEGRLDVGQEIASSLVRQSRDNVLALAEKNDCVILDASPGTACAAREAMIKSDLILLVAEPTPFGLHDLNLAFKMAKRSGKKCAVIVNRDTGNYDEMIRFCSNENLPVAARIPYIKRLAEDYSRGILDIRAYPEIRAQIRSVIEWLYLNTEHEVPL
jgi:MinD superfamily P-loop ATPase